MKKVTFTLLDEDHKRLKQKALDNDTTVTDLLRLGISHVLGDVEAGSKIVTQTPPQEKPLTEKILDRMIERKNKGDMPFDPF